MTPNPLPRRNLLTGAVALGLAAGLPAGAATAAAPVFWQGTPLLKPEVNFD